MALKKALTTAPLAIPFVLGLAAACSSAKPAAPVVAITASTAAPTATAEAEDPDKVPLGKTLAPWKRPARSADTAACKKLVAEQEAAAKKDAPLPEGVTSEGFSPPPCMPVPGGAWGLVSTIIDYEQMAGISYCTIHCGDEDCGPCHYIAVVALDPVFITDSGAVKRGARVVANLSGSLADSDTGTFDLDGDGAEEALFAVNDGVILTFKSDAISVYPNSAGLVFEKLVDFDQDARPDLVLRNPYWGGADLLRCGMRHGFPLLGIGFEIDMVARSLPDGTFSTTDPLSQRQAKLACPAKPPVIVAKDKEGNYDLQKIQENVVCARLFGMPAQAVEQALDSACTWPEDECEALFDARDNGATTTCAGRSFLLEWAQAKPNMKLQ